MYLFSKKGRKLLVQTRVLLLQYLLRFLEDKGRKCHTTWAWLAPSLEANVKWGVGTNETIVSYYCWVLSIEVRSKNWGEIISICKQDTIIIFRFSFKFPWNDCNVVYQVSLHRLSGLELVWCHDRWIGSKWVAI